MAQRPDSPPGQAMGKGMLVIAWLIVMALLTWYFGGVEEDRYNPNRQVVSNIGETSVEVILERNRWGHYVADGEINGVPVTFMVDTGATMVAIPLHLGDKLGLKAGVGMPVNTANGQTTAYATRIPELRLGDLVFRDVRGGLTQGMEGNEILLGMSVLANVSLLQEGNQLVIRQAK